MRIVFINTPGHSRSTVTGALLSNLSGALCVGESYNFFTHDLSSTNPEFSNVHCSCGERYTKCEFWGDYYNHTFVNLKSRYDWLLGRCERAGCHTIVETCSKSECLKIWNGYGLPITILRMRKPFFKWLKSMKRQEARAGLNEGKSLLWYLKDYYVTKMWGRRLLSRGIKVNFRELEAIIGWEDPKHHIAVGNRCKYTLPGGRVPAELAGKLG